MSTKIFSRAFYDDVTISLFTRLTNLINKPYNAYYAWSNPPKLLVKMLDDADYSKPITVIGIKDLLNFTTEFNWWHDTQQPLVQYIDQIARKHSDTKILLFTSLENLHAELNTSNIHIVPWGGDVVNQINEYAKVKPVFNKNFDSKKHFINLNRHSRDHRLVAVSYMIATGLLDHGVITFLFQQEELFKQSSSCFLDMVGWEFESPRHDEIREHLLRGYQMIRNNDVWLAEDQFDIYGIDTNNNINNFNTMLRTKYRDSFVEIVSESSFSAPSYLITEKTANSVYGCNFPIILSGAGAVDHLRTLGLDVFDDVVDHSYDTIKNPIDRVITAIESNRRLLTNSTYAKEAWQECVPRFKQNISTFANIGAWYTNRATQEFNKFLAK